MLLSMSRSRGSGSGQTTSSPSSSVTLNRRISLRHAHHPGGTAFSPGTRDNSTAIVISAASSIASFVSLIAISLVSSNVTSVVVPGFFAEMRIPWFGLGGREPGPISPGDKFTKYPWSQFPYLPRQMVSSGVSDQCFRWGQATTAARLKCRIDSVMRISDKPTRKAEGRRAQCLISSPYRNVWSAAELQAKKRMTVRSAPMYSAFGGVSDSWP